MRPIIATLLAVASSTTLSQAAIIVGLSPGDASNLYDSAIDGTGTVQAPSDNNAGLTMNATFTPNATDLGQSTNAITIVEIGGNANGTGLYLLGGELHFLSKMQGGAGNVVTTFDDLDFLSGNNMVGVISNFGALSAGIEYSVGVVYDPLGATPSVTIAVQPTGGSIVQQNELLNTGTKNNWSGNDTIRSFIPPSNAGGGTTTALHPFNEANMPAFNGTRGQALLWNAQTTIVPVPEPTSAGLLGLTALLLSGRRRR